MQRSITYPFYIRAIPLFILYLFYESLSSIYLFLPPLFGILFFYFIRSLEKQDISLLLFVSLLAMVYEADKGYLFLSSLVYFSFVYRFILPKLEQLVQCRRCLDFINMVIVYIGFWLFSLLLEQIFWLEYSTIDWHVLWYIVFEFLLIGIL